MQPDLTHRLEDVAWMAATGESLTGAARRLGVTASGLEKWLDRRGRSDLTHALLAHEPRDHNAPANNHDGIYLQGPRGRYAARRKASA
jgi:hypothetical protein